MEDEDVPRATVFPESSVFDQDEIIEDNSVSISVNTSKKMTMKDRREGEKRAVISSSSRVFDSATSRKQATSTSGLLEGGSSNG
jgi:hypothetical protein